MSDKITALPLLAIRSRRVRDDLDGLISRKREIKSIINSSIVITPEKMSSITSYVINNIDNLDCDNLLAFIKNDCTTINDINKEQEQIDDDLTALYIKNDFQKIVFPDGTSATKCTIPRTIIIKEKLLTNPKLVKHIDLEVIAECSETTESKPFVKVTFKKDQKGESK